MLLLFSIWCSKNYSNIAAVSVEYFNRRWTRVQINIVARWGTDISCVAIRNVWRGPERAGQKSNWSKSLGKWSAPGWSLCSHLRTNFKLIPVSPSYSLSTQTPLANFHSPTLPDTVYHQSSSLRWLTCFERLELLVSTLYLQFRRRRGEKKKTFVIYFPRGNTKKHTERGAAFPAVLHLTSRTRPNGPPSREHWGLMKKKFMDVEQLRHTDDEEFIPSPAGVCCYFIPEPLPRGAVQGTAMIKGLLFMFDKGNRLTCQIALRRQLVFRGSSSSFCGSLRLSLGLRGVSLSTHILKITDGRQAALLGNIHLFFFFSFYQVCDLHILLIHKVLEKSPSWLLEVLHGCRM